MICLWCGEKLRRVEYPERYVLVAYFHQNETGECLLPIHQRADAPSLLERLVGPNTCTAPCFLEDDR